MARNNSTLIAVGVLAAFAAGLIIGRTLAPQSASDDAPNSQDLIAAEPRDAGNGERRNFQERRADDAPRIEPLAIDGFAYERLVLDTSTDEPRACFQFTQDLDASGEINYADYVRLTPDPGVAASAEGASLCLTGLQFNADYRARLRAGLPAASGEELERTEDVLVAFGDKPSYVGFAGDGVILPRLEADGVGIETVNVEKLAIEVYRVSDRGLVQKNIVAGEATGENRYSYIWNEEDGSDTGVKVWEGEIETPSLRNELATTVFPLGAALPNLQPGAYFLKVRDASPGADDFRSAQSWRWILYTDLALTTYSSPDGIDVFVRSIDTGRPVSGAELSLIATNNDLLASAVTNGDGRARFDGALVNGDYPLTPRMIMAYGPQDDFAALDLSRAPLDLSDRNIAGRAAPSKIDGYIYLDRGIYRPGETAFITGLVRDDAGRAIEDRPLTVTIYRPNGAQADQRRIDGLDIGGYSFSFAVPDGAARGVWRVEAVADGLDRAAGRVTFSVEDFVPQRLEVSVEANETIPMRFGERRQIAVASRYLYGAPASALPVEAEARLRLDPNPFPDFSDFRFGPVTGRFDERFLRLRTTTTDGNGEAAIELSIDDAPANYGAPMRADVVVGVVEPGGRPVRESARVPVRPDDNYVGLRLADGKDGFGDGELASIDAVLLDWRGDVVEGELEWRLVEEDYWFDWYRDGGQWRWRRSFRDILISEGRAPTGPDALSSLVGERLEPGSYRLTVSHAGGKAKSAIRFYVGWRSYAAGAQSPDQASLTLQNETVAPGSRARLYLNPPYEGEALIAIATDRVHSVQRVKVGADGREITIETNPEWGNGFYVLATVVTPRDPVAQPAPRRAMGVAYVPFDMSERTLSVSLDAPQLLRPRQQLDLPIEIGGADPGEPVMVTLAAVDEGILRLTKFSSPDPVDHYYGKKRLGVEIRDDYGRILDPNLGAAARFGGDQLGGEGLTVVPTKSVALFSGLLTVGEDGRVIAPVDVPDFNGELRLMAVAWSANKLGSAAAPLTVRDAVPAVLALPRFLAPGDTATATLLIDNVDGAAGDYTVSLTGEGPVSIAREDTFTLESGEKATQTFAFESASMGIGAVNMSVNGPDGFSVSRAYPIQSRTPYFPLTEVRTAAMEPGETFSVSEAVLEPFVDGSTDLSVSFSRLSGIEPGPLLDSLYQYPYGCSEQLTSVATPLLFVDVLGGEVGRDPNRAVRPRVQKAINTLLNRQGTDGAFGLWRVSDRAASPWLGAYVTDFLYRAAQEGYGVPAEALERAYDSLADVARIDQFYLASYQTSVYESESSNDTRERLRRRSAAYASYVLTRAGRADLSDLRYFHDALLDDTPSPLAKAHIGAALSFMGDRARATSAFTAAVNAIGWSNTGDYYQTPLRDIAGVLSLAAEAGEDALLEILAEQLATAMKDPRRM
ncbi:MAG: alpha-2-macroglobulin, partial [Pseudomonadota bacterium]